MSSLQFFRETGRCMSDNTVFGTKASYSTLIKKKIQFSSYTRKFRWDRLRSHIWLTASLYMVKYLRIFSLALPHLRLCNWSYLNFLYIRKISFSFFISVASPSLTTALYFCPYLRYSYTLHTHPHVFVSSLSWKSLLLIQIHIFSRFRPNFSGFPRVLFLLHARRISSFIKK